MTSYIIIMIKCIGCRKEKDLVNFIKGEKSLKKCINCREQAKVWKDNNKERISMYNKLSVDKRNNEKESCLVIYAKKSNEDEWIKYKTQLEAANLLGLRASNINKVIKGNLKTTGGYEFKIEEQNTQKQDIPSWEQIKKENGFRDMVKGKPAKHRILHEEKNNIMGKCCCTCKEWKSLTNYNKAESHWDKLRNDCKDCLTNWRKNNRTKINEKFIIYEKNRKLTDPEFKLLKTLRSRLNSAVRSQNAHKNVRTLDLTSCSTNFLMNYLQAKFTEGMTWQNHGEWHIDHITPCAKFNLLDEQEQKKCFHYTNLQPLWAKDNLIKGSKLNN